MRATASTFDPSIGDGTAAAYAPRIRLRSFVSVTVKAREFCMSSSTVNSSPSVTRQLSYSATEWRASARRSSRSPGGGGSFSRPFFAFGSSAQPFGHVSRFSRNSFSKSFTQSSKTSPCARVHVARYQCSDFSGLNAQMTAVSFVPW